MGAFDVGVGLSSIGLGLVLEATSFSVTFLCAARDRAVRRRSVGLGRLAAQDGCVHPVRRPGGGLKRY